MGTLNPENTTKLDLNDSGCIQDASVSENSYKGQVQLLDLSDDVLLCILKLCSPRDLKALGHACPRLGALVCDRTLWTKVDARDSPMGHERLRWLLNHYLSQSTTELLISGYASRDNRCLGIQDLHWPAEPNANGPEPRRAGRVDGVDVEHFLLRMWYPHLPRFAVSPRWPDKREAEMIAKKAQNEDQHKAFTNGTPEPQASSSGTSNSTPTPPNDKAVPSSSGADAGNFAPFSASSVANAIDSAWNSLNSALNPCNFKPKKMKLDNPSESEEEIDKSCHGPQFTTSAELLKALKRKCTQLTSLSLEYCNIDFKNTSIQQLPPGLKKLSLRGTRCYNLPLNTSYLAKIHDKLPLLEYLDISECDWVEPASLMPLSKIPALEKLYMRDCKRLTECVAYASLATRYGFRKVKIVDVRGSPLADSEVSAFGWLPQLEELYCAPHKDYTNTAEHTHSWNEMWREYSELEQWELQEPEYYKIKEDAEEAMDEDDDTDASRTSEDNPWWSHERRIIVIQPNENQQDQNPRPPRFRRIGPHHPQVVYEPPVEPQMQQDPPAPPADAPVGPQMQQGPPAPPVPPADQGERGPSNNKRPASNEVLDLVKRPRLNVAEDSDDDEVLLLDSSPPVRPNNERSSPESVKASSSVVAKASSSVVAKASSSVVAKASSSEVAGTSAPTAVALEVAGANALVVDGVGAPDVVGGSVLANAQSKPGLEFSEGPSGTWSRKNASTTEVARTSADTPAGAPLEAAAAVLAGVPTEISAFPGTSTASAAVALAGAPVGVSAIAPAEMSAVAPVEAQAVDLAATQAGAIPVAPTETPPIAPAGVPPVAPTGVPPIAPAGAPPSGPAGVPPDVLAGAPLNAPAGEPPNAPAGAPPNAPGGAHARAPALVRAGAVIVRRGNRGNAAAVVRAAALAAARANAPPARDGQAGARPAHERRPGNRRNFVPLADLLDIDVDIHQNAVNRVNSQTGHQFVTDAAVLRFGRAENVNVNYIQIGRHGIYAGNELGSRPDRSNLRILSLTGYSNITDRSLEHLATAAPQLRLIDFTETRVSPRSVEVFKALRPDCKVIFSEFGKE